MVTQVVTQIFSYAFVFLLGVILGALGELVWSGRFGKSTPPPEGQTPPQIEIPQINVDLPVAVIPPSAPSVPAPTLINQPVPVIAPVPAPAKPSKEDAKKPVKVLSIVEQVDEILQELQKFSQSSTPNINLMDDGKQGVVVKVGNQSFPGIDAVTNQEAQTLIRKAVTEWERRTSKG